ncbi:hypothetical protein F2P56_035657 [Juglans regia]|uniref:Reverse transcriptase Ty1/copia-type domain-containing protein n=1 Tax=Juglans regia TaxID=51240 RepID=A0A833X6F4_JUGRE|nr:hypothetical protein F2P56_035657 [Juglans regia]
MPFFMAPRAWFNRFSQCLLELGFLGSSANYSLFTYHKYDMHIFILVYVDDIFVTGSHNSVIASLIQKLKSDFTLKDLGSLHYFLGIQVKRDFHGLHRRQSKYILDVLHRAHMVGAKPYSAPCTSGSKLAASNGDPLPHAIEYRQIVGALQYCTHTCPDIAYSTNQLCQHLYASPTTHWTAAKLVL